ncbi:hypothetical protein PNOK_0710200 [Pyrrhoderma noxium]|uniref:Uncharacterized protein n=1 Tax=Pyrrhoderma noxium TaxID=2282107 RepID=A0A286UBU3_9AGAM|nr:hypothetical protein PNOK_0710200 [Pyrrhoderma noxium]
MKLTVDNAASADGYVQRPSSNGQITDRFENRGNHDQDQSNYSHPPRLEHRSSGNHLHPTQNTESRKGEESKRHSRIVNRQHRIQSYSPIKNRPSSRSSISRQDAGRPKGSSAGNNPLRPASGAPQKAGTSIRSPDGNDANGRHPRPTSRGFRSSGNSSFERYERFEGDHIVNSTSISTGTLSGAAGNNSPYPASGMPQQAGASIPSPDSNDANGIPPRPRTRGFRSNGKVNIEKFQRSEGNHTVNSTSISTGHLSAGKNGTGPAGGQGGSINIFGRMM